MTAVGWNAVVAPSSTLEAFGYCANVTGGNSTPQIISPLGNSGTGGSGTGGSGTGGSVAGGGSFAGGGSTGDAGSVAGTGPVAGGGSTGDAGSFAGGGAATGGTPGYEPSGEYLQHPDRAVAVLKSLADFRAKARDNVNGGFYSFVNRNGTVGSDRRKGFVTTTRDAWTFSRAFMVTGDDVYLDHAAHALEHLYSHAWDNTYGGWYFTGNEKGALTPYSPYLDPNTFKWSFVQH